MKKRIFYYLGIAFLLVPSVVFAKKDGTSHMYINMDVKEDGSVDVVELAELSGSYNGRLRSLVFKNTSARKFQGELIDFRGSDIYNASSITDLKVCEASTGFSRPTSDLCEREFSVIDFGREGMSGVYEREDNDTGINLKIYNPSSRKKAFYISYTLHDVVVVHNDVAEIAWNLLGYGYTENIYDFKVWVNLPKKDSDLRVFLKGNENTLNGEIRRENDQTAYIYYNFLGAYNPVSVRMMFDKSITPFATKMSGVNGRENILTVEKEDADKANQVRDKIKRQNSFAILLTVIWFIFYVLAGIYFIFCKRRNLKTDFHHDYFRDLPGEYGPEVLQYLLIKNVTDKAMSSSLLRIVDKKVLKLEDNPQLKDDYFLVLQDSSMNGLSENEKMLCQVVVEKMGDGSKVSLAAIKNYGTSVSKAKILLEKYDGWRKNAKREGESYGFFQGVHHSQIISFVISIFSIFIVFLNATFETGFILGYLSIVFGIFQAIYVMNFSFRSSKGALEYAKWQAFKRFLKDFGMMDEKELPEVKLWGKYLVYASILGCADEVEKAMKLRLDSMNITESSPYYYDYYYMDRMMDTHLYVSLSTSLCTAVSASRSAVVASSSSSDSGFGGGSSFGGGSFGGGGGGGRF